MSFLIKLNIKNNPIVSILIGIVLVIAISFSVFAVESQEENSTPYEQSSGVQVQSSSEQLISSPETSEEFSSQISSESSLESSAEISHQISTESSQQSPDESSQEESSQTESIAEESSNESSEPEEQSYIESSFESSEKIIFSDPFEGINKINIILPIDNPNYQKPESSTEPSSDPPKESSSEISAQVSDENTHILDSPPVPQDESRTVQLYNSTTAETDNTSFLVGIIIWSVIGIIITAILIIVLHTKEGKNSDFSLGRNRYHKKFEQKTKRTKKLLSDKYYKR